MTIEANAGVPRAPAPTRRRRVMASFLVICVGSLGLLALLTTSVASNVIRQQATDRLNGDVQQSALYVGQVVTAEQALLGTYARRTSVVQAATAETAAVTATAARSALVDLAAQQDVRAAFLISARGTVVDAVPTGTSTPGPASSWFSASQRGAVVRALPSGALLIVVPVSSAPAGTPSGTARAASQTPTGALAVIFGLDALQTSLDDFSKAQNLHLAITDAAGTVVMTSPSGMTSGSGSSDITSTAPIDALGWRTSIWTPSEIVFGSITDLREAVLVVTAALLILVLVGLGVLSRSLGRQKVAEENLHHLALHDALTNLPNRVLFADRLERAISLARRRGNTVAVYVIDANNFKQVNDILGHAQGDLVLTAIARRLSATIRDSDTAARMGGDEFAVLAPDITPEAARDLRARLHAELAEPYPCGRHMFRDGASVGMSLFPGEGETFDALMTEADVAMYRAKRARPARERRRRPVVVLRRH